MEALGAAMSVGSTKNWSLCCPLRLSYALKMSQEAGSYSFTFEFNRDASQLTITGEKEGLLISNYFLIIRGLILSTMGFWGFGVLGFWGLGFRV